MRLRSNTNIIMNMAIFLPLPTLITYVINPEFVYLLLCLAVIIAIAAKFLPYFSFKNHKYYYRYSPFLPAVSVNNVDITEETITICGKNKMVFQYEDCSTKAYLAEKISLLTNNPDIGVQAL